MDLKLAKESREKDQKLVRNDFRGLMRAVKAMGEGEKDTIRRAFRFARDAHEGVRRKSGEPYIVHPIAVARIVAEEMGLDSTSVVCALLHDVVEDTHIEPEDIQREFGNVVRNIIEGLTKISGVSDGTVSQQAENFRRILLTISDDIRVVLIKIADRLHNMRTLGSMRRDKILKIASETQYIYVPLAHRLGLYEIKTDLEDLSLKFRDPVIYQEIEKKLWASREDAKQYIERFIRMTRNWLEPTGLSFSVKSRFKTIYSIFNKMSRQDIPFEEVYDTYAIRIILETREGKEKDDCWQVYARLSSLFTPHPKRIRDWITIPKPNGYESLHTTLMGPDGRWVEVQIRTERMDGVAEKGIAAHWLYKESTEGFEEHLADWISQVRDILENPSLNALEAVKEFRENIGQSDIYVFTPQGEMKRLPANSTAIDFAYKIHTNIGDTAIGAKVDNRVVTLDYNLKQADQIEIINSKKARPKEEWLDFARTSRAREGIKSALRRQRKELVDTGQKIFLRGARQFGVDEDHPYMKELLAFFRKATIEDFYFAIGNRQIAAERFQHFIELKRDGQSVDSEIWSEEEEQKVLEEKRLRNLGVDIDTLTVGKMNGIDNYEIADCCKPIPGDTILGFHDRNRVFIHRTTCSEAISLMSNYGSQIINTKWAEDQIGITFLAGLKVVGLDRQGMLNDLLRVISQKMKLNLRTVTIDSREGMFEGLFKVYVHNTDELDRLKKNLKELPHVYTVSRAERDFIPFQEGG